MQTFKDWVYKVLEGLALNEVLAEDLLMVNGYRLKIMSSYQLYYCL